MKILKITEEKKNKKNGANNFWPFSKVILRFFKVL